MKYTEGDAESHASDGDLTARMHMASGPPQGDPSEDHSEGFADLRDLAADRTRELRDTLGAGLHRAGKSLDERTGILTQARKRPLLAIGVVFLAGFVFAVRSRASEEHPHVKRVRHRLKTILISGIAAAVAQSIPAMAGEEGFGELLDSWIDGRSDDEDFDV